MPNLEWDVPHQIVSPEGTLDLNVIDPATGLMYQIQPGGYKIVPTIRVTQDNVSQQRGSVVHPGYTSGLVASMTVFYAKYPTLEAPDFEAACQAEMMGMHQALMLHVQALMVADPVDPNTSQRLIWTPTGLGQNRMIQAVQTLAWPDPAWVETPAGWAVTFSLYSPFPYAIDAEEDDTVVADGATVLIPNAGDTPFYPVYEIDAGTSVFVITNEDDTSQIISYDGVAIGGGGAEMVTFDGTIFQDGSGADLIAGLDPPNTDFFPIQPGGTSVRIDGGSMTVKSNSAYC